MEHLAGYLAHPCRWFNHSPNEGILRQMDISFAPYEGDEDFVFVCYAHEDTALVGPEIGWLHEQGVRIWYDAGIHPGTEWSEALATRIQSCSYFLYFLTARSISSENCRRELNFALEEKRNLVAVYLEDVEIPAGLRLSLNNRQAIPRYRSGPEAYLTVLAGPRDEVTEQTGTAATQGPATPLRPSRRWRAPVAICVLVALALVGSFFLLDLPEWDGSGSPRAVATSVEVTETVRRKTVAVLPFENLSPDPERSYFAAGMHEEVIKRLARLNGLRVISRTSMMGYLDSPLAVPEIARELDAAVVMEGSVRFSDGQVRVSVQLVAAETDSNLWSNVYQRELADVFLIQDEIALDVVEALEVELLERESNRLSLRRRHDGEAYDAYLMGLVEFSSFTPAGLQAAIGHFSRAVELDPTLVDARLYLAQCFQNLFEWQELPVDRMRMLAEPHIVMALQLDPDYAAAHSRLGILRAQIGDLSGAETAFQNAIELSPNSADVYADHAYVLLSYAAKPQTALDQLDRAAKLDPMRRSRAQQSVKGRALALLGRHDEALVQFEAQMAAYPDDMGVYVDLASAARGRSEAMRWWRLCAEKSPAVAACPAVVAGLLLNFGEYDEAERWLTRTERIDDRSGWLWTMRFSFHQRLRQEAEMTTAALSAMEYGSRASGAESMYVHGHLRWLQALQPERVLAYYQQYYPLLLQQEPQVTPRSYAAAISLAYLLEQRGDKTLASALLDRSLAVVEATPENWFFTDSMLGYDARAMIFTLRGDRQRALQRLHEQVDLGATWNWQVVEQEPIFASLAQLPGFQELLVRLRKSPQIAEELARIRDMERRGVILPLSEYPD